MNASQILIMNATKKYQERQKEALRQNISIPQHHLQDSAVNFVHPNMVAYGDHVAGVAPVSHQNMGIPSPAELPPTFQLAPFNEFQMMQHRLQLLGNLPLSTNTAISVSQLEKTHSVAPANMGSNGLQLNHTNPMVDLQTLDTIISVPPCLTPHPLKKEKRKQQKVKYEPYGDHDNRLEKILKAHFNKYSADIVFLSHHILCLTQAVHNSKIGLHDLTRLLHLQTSNNTNSVKPEHELEPDTLNSLRKQISDMKVQVMESCADSQKNLIEQLARMEEKHNAEIEKKNKLISYLCGQIQLRQKQIGGNNSPTETK